ncbi:MAG: EamA family transporter [Nitrososphaeria archaeon]|nr:EamA family transporter [Nitrososphaeria archaeon]
MALLAAFSYALSSIFAKRGFERANFLSAAITVTITVNIALWILVFLLVPLHSISIQGMLLFFLAGALAPGLIRVVWFACIDRIGASVTSSIWAVSPLFTYIFAILMLDEDPTLGILTGTILIVFGVVMIEMHGRKIGLKGMKKGWLILPLLGAMIGGVAVVVRKMGLNIYDEPIIGAAMGNLAALCLQSILITMVSFSFRSSVQFNQQTLRLFWKTAASMCAGWLLTFYALRYGDVTVVRPLTMMDALFIFPLAHLYLKGLESLSLRLIIGALIIIAGATAITFF